MTSEPLSRAEIEAEIERIETTFDSLEADLDETFEYESYLQGLQFALGEYDPPTDTIPSVETIDAIVSSAQDEFPESTIYVERKSTPPTHEHIGVIMDVSIDSVEAWTQYSDRLSDIAREHETENELVYTRVKRTRETPS